MVNKFFIEFNRRGLVVLFLLLWLPLASADDPPIGVCPVNVVDVAFVIDDTGSMGGAIDNVKAELEPILDDIARLSSGYRLALVTFKDDITIRLNFSPNNRNAFEQALQPVTASGGNNEPEASDEALNTVINALPAQGRPQNIDFQPPFTNFQRIIVLVTDAHPGSFDDQFILGVHDVRAHQRALEARAQGIRIAAVYVPTYGVIPQIVSIMQDYATTSQGGYTETEPDGHGTAAAIRRLLRQFLECRPIGTPPPPPPPPPLPCPNKLVFASNRETPVNLPGIWAFDLVSFELTRFSSVSWPQRDRDIAPLLSPDGCKVVWERQRDNAAFEVWVKDLLSGDIYNITPTGSRWANRPAWSPDSRRLALVGEYGGTGQIYLVDADGLRTTRLTESPEVLAANAPNWSPYGDTIAFSNGAAGRNQIYKVKEDGTQLTNLSNSDYTDTEPRWSPLGDTILFTRYPIGSSGHQGDIWTMYADGQGKRALTQTGNNANPVWSRRGWDIAFTRQIGSDIDLYTMRQDGAGLTRLTQQERITGSAAWGPHYLPLRALAYASHHNGNHEVYIYFLNERVAINLTSHPDQDFDPHW